MAGPAPIPLREAKSLLVVKPSSFGDVVHTLPAVHFLKQAYPHLEISWVVNPEWAPLLEGNRDLNRTLLFPRGQFRGAAGALRFVRWLGQLDWPRPDLALDFQGLFRSAVLCRVAKAPRIHCLGNAEPPARWLAHRVVPVQPPEHAVRRYLRLVSDLGVPVDGPLTFPMPMGSPPRDFPAGRPFLLLHPFSRGEGKSLSPTAVSNLCERLGPFPVVLVGRSDATLNDLGAHVINLLNQTSISELVWLCRNARFVCSVDSGPMHIAAAVTERVLGIHTWTDPRKVGPVRPEAWIWKNREILQVKALTLALAESQREFTDEDVGPLADFLRTQVSGS